MHQVQSDAQLVGETGFSGLVGESPVSVVMEKVHRLAGIVARGNNVEPAVILEIVDDHAGSHRKQIQPCLGSHIGEASDAFAGSERRQRQQVFGRNAGGVFPERHISQVQQPFHFQIVGLPVEIFREILNGFRRAGGLRVTEIRTNGKYAPLTRMAINVVVHLGFVQVTDPEHFFHQWNTARNIRQGGPISDLPIRNSVGHIAPVSVELSPGHVNIHHVVRPWGLGVQRALLVRRVYQRVQLLHER